VGEADFSAGEAGFGSCPKAAWNAKKQTAIKASDRGKNMNGKGWTKTPVYLAERLCNASNPRRFACGKMGPNHAAKTNVQPREVSGHNPQFGNYPAQDWKGNSLRLSGAKRRARPHRRWTLSGFS
jgi:hypothetical protein